MEIHDLDRFNKLAEAVGNRYQAIMFLSDTARCLGRKYACYRLSESALLEWVITGTCPYSKAAMERRKIISEDVDHIDEYLEYVDDDTVQAVVRKLYKQSINEHHLILCKDENLSSGRRSRINILLRMIWYHFDCK